VVTIIVNRVRESRRRERSDVVGGVLFGLVNLMMR